jgi:hypothetical protein
MKKMTLMNFLTTPSSSSSSSSSNGLPFEHLAHEQFSQPQSVAHFMWSRGHV